MIRDLLLVIENSMGMFSLVEGNVKPTFENIISHSEVIQRDVLLNSIQQFIYLYYIHNKNQC